MSSMLGFSLAHFVNKADEQSIFFFGGALTLVNIFLVLVFDEEQVEIEYKDINGHVINQDMCN